MLLGVVFSHTNPANYTKIPDDGKCRVLAMRGGGTKGAYEIGALKAMAEMLEPVDIAYDVLAGVSIGALNAAMFATFERGEEAKAIEKLVSIWQSYAITELWDKWPIFGYFAMIWKSSVIDNSKFLKMIQDEM